MFKLTYNINRKYKNKSNNIDFLISPKVTYLATTTNTILYGASGAALVSLMFG